jgi:hypothetical protein
MMKIFPSEPNMINTVLIASLILAGFAMISKSYASVSAIEEYELQEHCGKRAAEIYNKQFGSRGVINTEHGQALVEYTNHYNKKLRKCFVLQTYRNIPYKDKVHQSFIMQKLYDINENKIYGDYFKSDGMNMPTSCTVGNQVICHSEQEWSALVKPYMED